MESTDGLNTDVEREGIGQRTEQPQWCPTAAGKVPDEAGKSNSL